MVAQGSLQVVIVTARQRSSDDASIATGFNCTLAVDFGRQDATSFGGLNFKGRNQKDEMQTRIERKLQVTISAGDNEAAEFRRGCVIRMSFELGAEADDLRPLERAIDQRIERMEHPEPDGHAAAQSTRPRDFTGNRTGKRERLAVRRMEKLTSGLLCHRPRFELSGTRHRDKIVDLQRDSQAIETRTEIRSRRGDAHRNFLLFQKRSPENAGERTMALILTRDLATARHGRSN